MKKFKIGLALFALVLGVALSSFTMRNTTEYVWFNEQASYEFVIFGDVATAMEELQIQEQGTFVRAAVGYLPSRDGNLTDDPFVGTLPDPIESAELELDGGSLKVGTSAIVDEEIFAED